MTAVRPLSAVPGPAAAPADDMWAGTDLSPERPAREHPQHTEETDLEERPRVEIDSEPAGIVRVSATIEAGHLPETYVRQGALVQVARVSGDTDTDGVGHAIVSLTPDSLRRLMAVHTDVVRPQAARGGGVRWVPTSPTVSVCRAVLSRTQWETVPPLSGLIGAPVIRPDGTILQAPGYDRPTRLYYAPKLSVQDVPERPTPRDVAQARELLLEYVLADIPWDTAGDKTNYVGLLVSLMLRPYVGGLLPLGAVSATERGSGKTLLTDIITALYGATIRPWVSDDDELRKAITATLMGSNPAVVFDNVGEHDQVQAPTLAKLLTNAQWDDRVLGRSEETRLVNDRLWLVTGNNVRFGGDIAQRTVLVRLNPRCARPDLRSGFRIPDLFQWLEEPENRAALLRALLILCRDWVVAGAPRIDHRMRNFTRWACGVGGFLQHHGLPGFLENRSKLESQDDEQAMWAAFYAQWHAIHGSSSITTAALMESARPVTTGFGPGEDPWKGAFLTRADDKPLSAKSLGRLLASREDRHIGGYVLTIAGGTRTGAKLWRLLKTEEEAPEEAQTLR